MDMGLVIEEHYAVHFEYRCRGLSSLQRSVSVVLLQCEQGCDQEMGYGHHLMQLHRISGTPKPSPPPTHEEDHTVDI